MQKVVSATEHLQNLKVLVIGDVILDKYVFVQPKGRAVKDPILSVGYERHETYAGGVLAVANHISSFVKRLHVVTVLGDTERQEGFVRKSQQENATMKIFTKEQAHTTMKKRFLDSYRNTKLFKIEYMEDRPLNEDLTKEVLEYLEAVLPEYDMVIVSDFGHGFINGPIRRLLEDQAKFLAVNAQSNSANMGYNYANHYKRADFLALDEQEVRLPCMMRFEPLEEVVHEFSKRFTFPKFLITRGKSGALYYEEGEIFNADARTTSVTDTVGAGDAAFAIASLYVAAGLTGELVPLVANCAGGLKVKYMGNKDFIHKQDFVTMLEGAL